MEQSLFDIPDASIIICVFCCKSSLILKPIVFYRMTPCFLPASETATVSKRKNEQKKSRSPAILFPIVISRYRSLVKQQRRTYNVLIDGQYMWHICGLQPYVDHHVGNIWQIYWSLSVVLKRSETRQQALVRPDAVHDGQRESHQKQ